MRRDRVIVDFDGAEDAKKVEETVKTGYAETAIETVIHWIAVEEDLVDSYGRLAAGAGSVEKKAVFGDLENGSKSNVEELRRLLAELEVLDRARVARIESLTSLPP
ncbi:MAG TPA: hypothetical protein VEB67_02795 [Nitrososphaerales archaeon]|nr:hypothetical protein [Nitrososphaerales archaeon]